MPNIYSAGIYARLSVDSHNEKNESIETQIQIAKDFVKQQPDMVLFDCYSDLGKTGTNFEREGFNRLMRDVRLRKVDCVIVKDFSRFGRNYIETGNYIQKIFPFLGVRFISITDYFDSLYVDGDELGINLKNLANEMYARDIAVKVKSSRKTQWEKGSYTGGLPPYGYRAEWIDGKKCLFAEETTSELVKELYRLYGEGKNLKELVEWLYEKKVHRPGDYRRYGHIFREEGEELREWTRGSVRLLLTNPVYMGCMVQARSCGSKYRIRKKQDIASGDWSVKENTHEALVTQEQFFQIAERFEKQAVYGKRSGFSKGVPMGEDAFAGLLFCGSCKRRMARVSSVKEYNSGDRLRVYSYFCRNSSRIDSFSCEKRFITAHALTELVKEALKKEFFLHGIRPKELAERNRKAAAEKKRGQERKLAELERGIEYRSCKGSTQYLKYRSGDITKEAFLKWKEDNEKQIQGLQDKRTLLSREIRELDAETEKRSLFLRALLNCNDKTELTGEALGALIEKIRVFPDKRVEITFRFSEPEFLLIAQGGGSHEQAI